MFVQVLIMASVDRRCAQNFALFFFWLRLLALSELHILRTSNSAIFFVSDFLAFTIFITLDLLIHHCFFLFLHFFLDIFLE